MFYPIKEMRTDYANNACVNVLKTTLMHVLCTVEPREVLDRRPHPFSIPGFVWTAQLLNSVKFTM